MEVGRDRNRDLKKKKLFFCNNFKPSESCKNIAQNYHILYTHIAQLLTFYCIYFVIHSSPSSFYPFYIVIFPVTFETTLQIRCPYTSKHFCLYKLKNDDTTIVQFLKNQRINFNATSLVFSNCLCALANGPLLGIPFSSI